MSLLRALFGPSQDEVWSELARQVGGSFRPGGFLSKTVVQVEVGDWILTLDTYQEQQGNHSQTHTRLRAPYVNPEGFTFQIYRTDFFTGLGKAFGMQDIEVGHPRFDDAFVIKGNSERRVRRLFANDRIRRLISRQPKIKLEVRDDEGWFSARFPAGVDELVFTTAGVIKDLDQLSSLFELFAEVLNQLCHDGEAYEDDVELHIRRLRAPGGRIQGEVLLWEGDRPRWEAAEALGRLGDEAAVTPLIGVLRDEDTAVRARAIDALARIGSRRAVRPLIPLLGDERLASGRPVRDRVAEALRALGQDDVVEAVMAAFEGDFEPIEAYDGPWRDQIIGAFEEALLGVSAINAARSLARLRSVASLPTLRRALGLVGSRISAGRAIEEAIEKLQARAALPRPAARDEDVSRETLPAPASEPGDDTSTLPRARPKE
jgi:hypothetical protein